MAAAQTTQADGDLNDVEMSDGESEEAKSTAMDLGTQAMVQKLIKEQMQDIIKNKVDEGVTG